MDMVQAQQDTAKMIAFSFTLLKELKILSLGW